MGVVSGAQTGVDRGALDAALDASVPCGGWVPHGREAEDGAIPEHYPMQEIDGGYRQRTKANVEDSSGTVIIYFERLHGGTELTLHFCLKAKKPYLLSDASEIPAERAAEKIRKFVGSEPAFTVRPSRLNFAGPRESSAPGARDYTYTTVSEFLKGRS